MPIWIPLERENHREQAQLSGKAPCLHPLGSRQEFRLIIIRIKAKGAQLTLAPCSGSHRGSSSGTCSGMQLAVLPCAGVFCGAGRAGVKAGDGPRFQQSRSISSQALPNQPHSCSLLPA